MTPWHRFWFPDDPASRSTPRDAALWSPLALADLQRSLWHQAAEATAHWWQFVSIAWPSLPAQPVPGSVQPPSRPDSAMQPGRASKALPPAKRAPRRTRSTAPAKSSATVKRPRSVSRGK